ncbi:hypothetical protein J7L13_03660 [bacterium]|nr:hypothetical protein [bacterium]
MNRIRCPLCGKFARIIRDKNGKPIGGACLRHGSHVVVFDIKKKEVSE